MKIDSKHLLIDLINIEKELCLNIDGWLEAFKMAAKEYKFRVVGENSYLFVPPEEPGMTAFIMLDTSHFSIHTYANEGKAALDLFACTKNDLEEVWVVIQNRLKITDQCIASKRTVERFTDGE